VFESGDDFIFAEGRHLCMIKRFNILSSCIISNRKKLPCSKCDNVYTSKALLDAHFVIHTGEKPFACTVCNKSFTFPTTLTTHMRRHTNVRPFKCKICFQAFRLVVKHIIIIIYVPFFFLDIFWLKSFKFMRSCRRSRITFVTYEGDVVKCN